MTVLGTATKVYAGGTAAVAVYAGSVKVWPTAPPPPAAAWPVIPDSGLELARGDRMKITVTREALPELKKLLDIE
jgi:hypothetical protein